MDGQEWTAVGDVSLPNFETPPSSSCITDPLQIRSTMDNMSSPFTHLEPSSTDKVERTAFRCPLHLQHALQSLQEYPRSFIHAWLILARSLDLSLPSVHANYQAYSTLSIDQLSAIVSLKDQPMDQVLAWGDDYSAHGRVDEDVDRCNHSSATTCRSSTCSSVWTKRSSSNRSSKSSFTSLFLQADGHDKEKRISKRMRKNTASDLLEVPETDISNSLDVEQASIYRCTGCPRTFRSMQTWSRHEKEDHEDISFPCMPDGAIEFTLHGRQCALCGQEPTEEHLRSHNIEQCTQLKHEFKRIYELRKHLESHGLPRKSKLSDILVSKWQRVPDKQAWACGFCRRLCPSLAEFHKHVAVEHYERGEDRPWDHTKVILGLLSQPHIAQSWDRLLASRFRVQKLSCKWSKSRTGCLQTRLSSGQEPGDVLAEAALDCAMYDHEQLQEIFRRNEPPPRGSEWTCLAGNPGPPVPPKPLPVPSSSNGGNIPKAHVGQKLLNTRPPSSDDMFKTPSPPIFDAALGAYTNIFDHPSQEHLNDFDSNHGLETINHNDVTFSPSSSSPPLVLFTRWAPNYPALTFAQRHLFLPRCLLASWIRCLRRDEAYVE
ncbi:MAG: hypothetical protein Q9181_001607 [Wetmoreana brouardii]